MTWIVYALAVIAVSILIGLHLGRFRIAYTEMSGMMLGMTMGMLNGFLLGYAAAAAAGSMFWGNLFGILLGLGLGIYFGRAGGLMGIMDGGMGGVMGGSMGAMLAVMVAFPNWAQGWTAVLLTTLYILGMAGLVALIEQSAPEHAALHRLLPMFTRAVAREAEEQAGVERVERALAVLTDNQKRKAYDRKLARSEEHYGTIAGTAPAVASSLSSTPVNSAIAVSVRGDCCPPPKQKAQSAKTNPLAASGSSNSGVTVSVPVSVSARVAGEGSNEGNDASRGTTLQSVLSTPSSRPTEKSTASIAGSTERGPVRGRSVSPQAPRSAQEPPTTSNKSDRGREKEQPMEKQASKQARGKGQSLGQGQLPSRAVAPRSAQQVKYARKPQTRQVQPSGQQSTVIAVPWIGGVVVILLLAALGWWVFTAAGGRGGTGATGSAGGPSSGFVGAAGETQAQLDQQAVVAQVGADGKQNIDIVLNSATFQYEPKVVKVKQGAPVHFNLSVKNGDPG